MIRNLSVNISANKNLNKKYIHNIVKELRKDFSFKVCDVQISFIDNEEILKINKEYLKHNYPTDIITFDYSETKNEFDSEIYVSLDEAKINANKYEVPFKNEIMRLVIHGFLHLLGYNDKSQKEKVVMKRLENQLVNKYKAVVNQE